MNRQAGMGLVAFSLVLVVIGAIMEFAVSVTTKGFNINTIGMILLVVGIVGFIVSIAMLTMGGNRRTSVQEDIRNVPGGQQRVVEQKDNFSG